MNEPLTVVKELTDDWNRHVTVGTTVYRFHGYTYGCIGFGGIAVSLEPDTHPFFEVPADAVDPEQLPDRVMIGGE